LTATWRDFDQSQARISRWGITKNVAGLICKVSEDIAIQIAKYCRRRQPHSYLTPPPRGMSEWVSSFLTAHQRSIDIHNVYASVLQLHRVSKKLCQLIFCSLSVKYEPISIKIGRSVPEYTLNKIVPKMPTSPKACACTTLGNLKCHLEPSTQ